jgi:RNA polymerase sigma factor (sigma-70 family)
MPPPPFSLFLEQHRHEVLRLLTAMVGPDEADDCFQETFLKALRAWPDLRETGSLRAWVLTIARRTAIDAIRARGRRAEPVAEPEARGEDGVPLPADGSLWAAVRALPPKQRAAVALHYVGDLDYAEVGRAMETSEDAARRSAFEGMRTLREVWHGGR